jgi:hypothetical protein
VVLGVVSRLFYYAPNMLRRLGRARFDCVASGDLVFCPLANNRLITYAVVSMAYHVILKYQRCFIFGGKIIWIKLERGDWAYKPA